jgi:hypothetical protein
VTIDPIAQNLRLLGRSDLGGHPNGGEGMAMKVVGDRRILYIAHENPPIALTILDVTDPRSPALLHQAPLPHVRVRSNSLALHGDTLLMAFQTRDRGDAPAGMQLYDVSDPARPVPTAFFDTSGPHSRGVHMVTTMDGKYAHLSTGAPDFEPAHPKDDQFYMIVDINDPAAPREEGRWWLPGQRKGDAEALTRHPEKRLDAGYRVHHALSYPDRPDRAYLGYIDGGVVILDIARHDRPRMVSRLDYHPPMPGFTHTVVPLFGRGLLIVTDEASGEFGDDGYDWPKLIWVVDARVETNPVILATAPKPAGFKELHRVGGRIGAHNVHENEPVPGSAVLQNTVVATWFSAGLRIYDIGDPFRPEEIAAFIPATPPGQRGSRISDVFVDDRKIIYALDRAKGGLYILEYTGAVPLT